MAKLHSFDEFVFEESNRFHEETKHFEKSVETVLHKKIWEGLDRSTYFTADEKTSLWIIMEEAGLDGTVLNESILGKMRDAVKKLGEKGAKIKEETLEKLEDVMKSATNFAKYLKDLLFKTWDKLIGYFQKKYLPMRDFLMKSLEKDEIKAKVLEKSLVEEIKNLKDTLAFWLKTFRAKLGDAITTKYSQEVLKECLEHDGDLITELSKFDPNNIPLLEDDDKKEEDTKDDKKEATEKGDEKGPWAFLNRIKHHIEKIPPFSWLEKVAEIGAKGAKFVLTKLSEITNKAGGPGVFEFAGLAALMGLAFEYKVKHFGLDMVEDIFKSEGILRMLPMARSVVNLVEWIAICLMVINIAEDLMKKAGNIPAEETEEQH